MMLTILYHPMYTHPLHDNPHLLMLIVLTSSQFLTAIALWLVVHYVSSLHGNKINQNN